MITSVRPSAMSATSETSSDPVVNESAVRNSGESDCPTTAVTTRSPTSSVSQRPSAARSRPAPSPLPAAVGVAGSVAGVWVMGVSAGTAGAPSPEGGVDAQADEPIESDGDEQQRADGRLLPEGLDLQDDQRGRDGAEQQRAQRRSVDASRAAEDGDVAD